MKLANVGLTWAGQPLERNQFALIHQSPNPHVHGIAFWCRGGKKRICTIPLTEGPADNTNRTWHWDGDKEAPTISPSIGCDQRCGWHGHIINGEILP